MNIDPFTLTLFFKSPVPTLAFFALLMAIASIWIRKTPWLWGSFLLISLLCALESHIIDSIALLPLTLLAVFFWSLRYDIRGFARFVLVSFSFLIAAGLFFHFLPGFHNWNILHKAQISSGAIPYNLWLNYDKPFVALFILSALTTPLYGKAEWKKMIATTVPWVIITVILLFTASLYVGKIHWDPKLPEIFPVWLIVNLFFTVIPEETLLRGFLQKEIFHGMRGGLAAHISCVFLSSGVFTLFHVNWVGDARFLLLVFLAGLLYGTVYQYTRRIESSILCHLTVNICHILLFTYPG